MRVILFVLIVMWFSTAVTTPSFGAVTSYINKAAWQANAGPYATINFTELPADTFIFEQYANLGVHFTDGSDVIFQNQNLFSDNFGLNGAFNETTLEFDTPMTTIALDFPGGAAFKLYSNGQLIYTSIPFGLSGPGNFAGLISTQPFDEVVLFDPEGDFFADTVYFGPPIPAPGALTLLGIAGFFNRSRRRTT